MPDHDGTFAFQLCCCQHVLFPWHSMGNWYIFESDILYLSFAQVSRESYFSGFKLLPLSEKWLKLHSAHPFLFRMLLTWPSLTQRPDRIPSWRLYWCFLHFQSRFVFRNKLNPFLWGYSNFILLTFYGAPGLVTTTFVQWPNQWSKFFENCNPHWARFERSGTYISRWICDYTVFTTLQASGLIKINLICLCKLIYCLI